MTPTPFFLVSALVATLVVSILAIVFCAKWFRSEPPLAVALTVITVGGWLWRMPQRWYTISQVARRYGVTTHEVQEIAKKLGIRAALNRGALLPPSQRKKMQPELMRLKRQIRLNKQKAVRESSAANNGREIYESWAEHPGFLEEADRMQFSGDELLRHLYPSINDYVADIEDEAG